ncbi:MAG: exodeoxyribonuclease VII large subunit [Acetobacteraceae bacterium]|nr:exodeoxyribonuclease VII large subunit [Acetobacteraceae bacterium]
MSDALLASNIPEYTVSEISGAVKHTLESTFSRVRVRGEVTELRRHSSGHIYFALKDERAKLAAVVWRSAVPRLGLQPEDGVEVIATGRISTYSDRSTYQLIVERLEYAGIGALLARIEALRQKLAAEGLFAAERKRKLPLLPAVVGVITSEEGAVLHDIRTTVARRFPRPILLWPVPVQGEGAAERIAAAIRGFGALPAGGPIPRPDVLIVARGGGSLEDLMAFNDEAVVRAAASCPVPLISAVGHETDTTLIDYAADRRAPTPTAAAELAVPMRTELLANLQNLQARLSGALSHRMKDAEIRLERAASRLPDLPGLLGQARQRLDDRAARLALALPNLLAARRAAFQNIAAKLPDPRHLPAPYRAALTLATERLRGAMRHALARHKNAAAPIFARLSAGPIQAKLRLTRARLEGVAGRLAAVSPLAVLERGYAVVYGAGGKVFTRAAEVPSHARLKIRFADGLIGAREDGSVLRQGELPLDG